LLRATGEGGAGGPTAPMKASSVSPRDCAAWLLLSFHNFGYKVIQLKEVTENKAMQGRVGGGVGVYSA